ncbi:MAG: hypothetical protein IKG87_13720 [Clostridia bacterium]|nr:hypothetical protein [Clostridia bacterium]
MIDYENVSSETLKEWEREYRNKCRREMTQYLKDFPDATPEEIRALSSWVRSGHSPYENGDYIATDSGGPMDFINAWCFQEELYQVYLKNPEEFRDARGDEVRTMPSTNPNSDLPS